MPQLKRSALLIVLAMVFLEWLDFSLYLYLARAIFAKEFFPPSDYSLTLTFAVFAAAYLARPLGGWLFGREADLNGRKKPMVLSAALMGLSTLGICILPGYQQIGILAAWGLLVLRIGQGLALGGEINTSAMFLVEHHPQQPLLAGSLVAASGALGLFCGGAMAALIQSIAYPFAWRLLFAAVGIISLWVCARRKKLSESPEFHKTATHQRANALSFYWPGLLNIAAVGAFVSIMVYLCNIYWQSFAIDCKLWGNVRTAWTGSSAQLASALIALPIARNAKSESSLRLLQISLVCIFLTAPVLFYATASHHEPLVYLGLSGYILGNGFTCAALYFFLYQQLPTKLRCQGVSTVWALAASFGAICLPIAEQAVHVHHMLWLPGAMVSLVALLTFIILSMNKTSLVEPTHQAYYQSGLGVS